MPNIPADVIILETENMKEKRHLGIGNDDEVVRDTFKKISNIFSSHNVALFGSTVTSGSATCMVFRTGKDTVISKIGVDIGERTELF